MLPRFVHSNYYLLKQLLDLLPRGVRSRLVHEVLERFPELRSIAVNRRIIAGKGTPNPVKLDSIRSDSRKRVLVVEKRLPMPDMTSASARLQAMLEVMVDLGCQVTFISNAPITDYHGLFDGPNGDIKKYERKLTALNVAIIYGPEAAGAHLWGSGESYAYAILSYPEIMYDYSPLVRAYCPNAILIYDTVDLHGVRYMREYDVRGDAALKRKVDYYNAIEAANIKSSDQVIAITADEAQKIRLINSEAKVEVIPNVHRVEGVRVPFSARDGLMFIGNYLHSPNEDAVAYFVSDILPLITAEIPNVRFYVVGSCVTDKIKRLAGPNVQVVGYVEDPTEYFNNTRVFVAPLRYGAGMKGKIGQSMSFGLPVVTTAIGAEGMGLVNERSALIADKPDEFAGYVLRLYKEEALWSTVSERSQKHVKECFSSSAVRHAFVRLLDAGRMAIK